MALELTLLVTAFRLKDAFYKWERATQLILSLHMHMRAVMAQLAAYLSNEDPEVRVAVLEIRRLLLLGCVLLKAFVREEARGGLEYPLECGLLLPEEDGSDPPRLKIRDRHTKFWNA